jgi:MFS family permease
MTEVSRDEVQRAQRTILWDGVFARFMDTMTGGAFLAGLALYLGASTFVVALIAALPFLAQVAQFPAVQLLMRAQDRRRVVVIASGIARSMMIIIALWAFFAPDRFSAVQLLGILSVSSLVIVVSNAAWNWWMRDIMPRAELGRYFARRLQITATIAALAAPVAGFSLDWFEARGHANLGYAILFGLGGLSGLASTTLLAFTPHYPAPPGKSQRNALRAILEPLKERKTRRLAFALMMVAATLTIMFPFTAVFLLGSLHYSFLGIAVLALVSQFAYVGSLRAWGYLSDHYGNRPVLQISVGMILVSLGGWSFTWGGTVASLFVLLLVLHFLSGFAVAGIDLTAHNILLKTAPEQGAPAYMAAISMSRAIVAGLATLVAGATWQAVGGGTLAEVRLTERIAWTIGGFHMLSMAAFVVGIGALLALRRIEETGRAPIREVARAMRREVRMLSSVAGIRAFVHAVSYVVEFFSQEHREEAVITPSAPPPTPEKTQPDFP